MYLLSRERPRLRFFIPLLPRKKVALIFPIRPHTLLEIKGSQLATHVVWSATLVVPVLTPNSVFGKYSAFTISYFTIFRSCLSKSHAHYLCPEIRECCTLCKDAGLGEQAFGHSRYSIVCYLNHNPHFSFF